MTEAQIQENKFKSSISNSHRKYISQFDRKEIQRRFAEAWHMHNWAQYAGGAELEIFLKRRTVNICLNYGSFMADTTVNGINKYLESRK